MNIEIANRLVELRKKSGLSQEDLADKIGVSRQAISKWETASASPDTDNLICLAKLYNVSLDDLLNTEQPVEDIVKQKKEENSIKESENISDDDDDDKDPVSGIICSICLAVAAIAYIVICATSKENCWGDWWVLFLIALMPSDIYKMIKFRRVKHFPIVFLVTSIYLIIGLFCDLWHPSWVIFLTIPLFYIIVDPIDKIQMLKRKNKTAEQKENKEFE